MGRVIQRHICFAQNIMDACDVCNIIPHRNALVRINFLVNITIQVKDTTFPQYRTEKAILCNRNILCFVNAKKIIRFCNRAIIKRTAKQPQIQLEPVVGYSPANAIFNVQVCKVFIQNIIDDALPFKLLGKVCAISQVAELCLG